MKNTINKLNFQRNGVAGTSFYSALLSKANGQKGKFLATFESNSEDGTIIKPTCRVINLENTLESWDGRNIAFEIENELSALKIKHNKSCFYELIEILN